MIMRGRNKRRNASGGVDYGEASSNYRGSSDADRSGGSFQGGEFMDEESDGSIRTDDMDDPPSDPFDAFPDYDMSLTMGQAPSSQVHRPHRNPSIHDPL
jgi:hypothetical protein